MDEYEDCIVGYIASNNRTAICVKISAFSCGASTSKMSNNCSVAMILFSISLMEYFLLSRRKMFISCCGII